MPRGIPGVEVKALRGDRGVSHRPLKNKPPGARRSTSALLSAIIRSALLSDCPFGQTVLTNTND